ncbi:hypothetical protein LWI29_016148 [Acer saccharum]|uniref:Reverse transcriptase domain-containing protein n=1 Tax=Acer saccharum TaxID=4024 RepID=A0AA39T3C8_ACESA|nr:hypothetical protein LWI29_016148 [Acer saccharum]
MHDFDIIFGMDWLSTYRANVKCFEKEVVFNPPGEHEFSFVGINLCSLPRLISSLQARKYLRKGYMGYLASVEDTKKSGAELPDVLVVNEFPDVFPDDLSCIPPKREIEFTIDLIPSKVNVVADALSRKSTGSSAALIATEKQIIWDLKNFNIEVVNARSEGFLGMIVVQPTLIKRIKEEQFGDVHLRKIKEDVATGKRVGFNVSNDGVLWFEGRLCVPSNVDFKNGILSEMHKSLYSVHP